MTSKKQKIEPVVIVSREGLQASTSALVNARLRHAELKVRMEQEVADVQRRYQDNFDTLNREIATLEAGIFVWAEKNRATEFSGKQSIDCTLAIIGFRKHPHAVEKIRSKDSWSDIAARLAALSDQKSGFIGENYVRYADPVVDKEKLIADRSVIPAQVLAMAGLRVIQDEQFYITPKSEIIDGTTQEAA